MNINNSPNDSTKKISHHNYQFTDKPKGTEQFNGEYCNQHQDGDDSFSGQYYYPTEKGNYFWYDYWV